jgi:hypothetical protein
VIAVGAEVVEVNCSNSVSSSSRVSSSSNSVGSPAE